MVQKPINQYGCWGMLSKKIGYCMKQVRFGKLTCFYHRSQERNAIALKRKLEKNELP